MPLNYVEVRIQADVDSGELLAVLEKEETLGCWEKDGIIYLYWREGSWDSKSLNKLKQALEILGIQDAASRIRIDLIPDKDWNAGWAESLQPIYVGRKLRIRQSWHPEDADFKGIELVLDPERAFGTGYHATTQLVLEWLEENIKRGMKILDIGTGSGILGMASLRFGAASVLAIDNDPDALECAEKYARINGFRKEELELRLCSWEELGEDTFDIIVANLDIRTMPRLCGKMTHLLKPGGVALLSGLLKEDRQTVCEALTSAGLRITAQMQREEWFALEVSFHSERKNL